MDLPCLTQPPTGLQSCTHLRAHNFKKSGTIANWCVKNALATRTDSASPLHICFSASCLHTGVFGEGVGRGQFCILWVRVECLSLLTIAVSLPPSTPLQALVEASHSVVPTTVKLGVCS